MSLEEDSKASSKREEFLIKEILLTHNLSDHKLDSELLLQLVEGILCCPSSNAPFGVEFDAFGINEIDLAGSGEPISKTIYKISNQILCLCFEDESLHTKTLDLLKILSLYRWDAKVALALASFAHIFGLFSLIFQLQNDNALGFLLAKVQQMPKLNDVLKSQFKAMARLMCTIVKLAKSIITFENWKYELLDDTSLNTVKPTIYLSTYWIIRSVMDCSLRIADLKGSRFEQVNSDDTVIEACSLHSLGMKLNSLCLDLEGYLRRFHEHIDAKLYQKLLNMSVEKHNDNQKVLQTLFSSKHKFPFIKNSYLQEKHGISELKDKIVMLLISKPELFPIDKTLWLVQQTYDYPQHNKFKGRYEIVWVPIRSSNKWILSDIRNFKILSNLFPWFSIRWPSSLNPTVVRFIEQEWKFKEDPIIVVLDENGMVTNTNAMDMIWIWGPKAFPFSSSREEELWTQENLNSINLLVDGFSPLVTRWVDEKKNICIIGSENLEWIREVCSMLKKIRMSGIQLEVIYVGFKSSNKNAIKTIINTIDQENLCTPLSLTKVNFFWFRLEIIKRSLGYQELAAGSKKITTKLTDLLDFNHMEKGWVMIGGGFSNDAIKLQADELKECLQQFPMWCKNVEVLGLVGAIRNALDHFLAGGICNHIEVLPYEEGLKEKVNCPLCGRPKEIFVLYKCEA